MPIKWTERFTDNFNRANEIPLAPPWTNAPVGNRLQLRLNMVTGQAASVSNMSYYSGYLLKPIQYAEVDIPVDFNGGIRHGLIIRFTGSSGYICRIRKFDATFTVGTWINANVASIVPALSGAFPVGACRLRFQAVGNVLSVYRNGVLMGSGPDSNNLFPAGQKTGIYTEHADVNVTYMMDNFSTGDGTNIALPGRGKFVVGSKPKVRMR